MNKPERKKGRWSLRQRRRLSLCQRTNERTLNPPCLHRRIWLKSNNLWPFSFASLRVMFCSVVSSMPFSRCYSVLAYSSSCPLILNLVSRFLGRETFGGAKIIMLFHRLSRLGFRIAKELPKGITFISFCNCWFGFFFFTFDCGSISSCIFFVI